MDVTKALRRIADVWVALWRALLHQRRNGSDGAEPSNLRQRTFGASR